MVAMKEVLELNLFVRILYYSYQHNCIGDKDGQERVTKIQLFS